MTPYYNHAGITIYHGHWKDVVANLPLVDCVLTDPPYGETSLDWDEAEIAWLSAMDRIVKSSGSIWSFGSLRYLSWLLRSNGMSAWRQAQEIVWEKHNGSNFHADRFKRVHELIVQLYKRETLWRDVYKRPIFTNDATARTVRRKRRPTHTGHIEAASYESQDGGPRLMTSVLFERSCHGYAEHPTQKPLGILKTILEYSCPEKGLVLDLFVGSGSTLVAAAAMGCEAIGIEINEEFCEIAARRLRDETMPLDSGRCALPMEVTVS
jgi:site-specific DNA-methyltransferase (adenine-specific)